MHYAVFFLATLLFLATLKAIKYKKLSEKDQFTGTFHRRWFDLNLVKMMREAKSKNKPLGLAFIDLDNFKTINDTKGHAYGDEVLLAVVKAIGHHAKLARYGGDEFVLILPHTTESAFHKELFTIQETVRNTGLITVSIGGAIFYPCDDINFSNLVNRADKGLYIAKAKGGDCVELYADKALASTANGR